MAKTAAVADLVKYKLSLAVTFSGLTGYFIAGNGLNSSVLLLFAGLFFLTAGAAALNQYTEREYDAVMPRTGNRPLPARKLKPGFALFLALSLIFSGLLILSLTGTLTFILGFIAILLYNFAYTRLKRITLFSVVPGALVGAVPPLIGYFCAGGIFPSNGIILFSAFMFLWQLPHFWLILIRYREEYEKAGFVTFREQFSDLHIRLLILSWVLFTTVFLIFFSQRVVVFSQLINTVLMMLNVAFIMSFSYILFNSDRGRSVRGAFILINSFSVAVMILFIVNSLVK
jgi:heme o synthase